MAEHLTEEEEEVLLRLPHRQFVFTLPKALRIFFRNDRKLFADISRLIFSILKEFYKEAAGKVIQTGMVIAHQTFGDMLRWNPHFHCIVLDGGFDEDFPEETECDISSKACRKAWARMLSKIYEINPFTCPKCGSDMKVIFKILLK